MFVSMLIEIAACFVCKRNRCGVNGLEFGLMHELD